MYRNSSPPNGSVQSYSYRADNKYSQGTNMTHIYGANGDTIVSPQSENHYSYAPTPQPLSSGGYSVNPSPTYKATRDPLAIAHQTDKTLTALASARRLSREYIKEPSNVPSSPPRGSYNRVYSQHHQSGFNDPSDPYNTRSNQVRTPSSSTPTGTPKSTDGRACISCGKVFGRPSALKIHMAIHTGEKAYICPEAGCRRNFSVRSNMSRHVRNVHKIWPDGHEEASDSDGEIEER